MNNFKIDKEETIIIKLELTLIGAKWLLGYTQNWTSNFLEDKESEKMRTELFHALKNTIGDK